MKVELAGGEIITLGTTETAPTISIIDYSRRVTDDFGVTTVVERGFARRMSVRLAVPFEDVDAIQRRLADLRATAALWVADDRFSSLSVEGFYKDFSLDLAVPPVSYCTLTIEGLAASEPFTDPGGDPAPEGRTSTLQLLQPVVIAGANLVTSNVPENDYPEWTAGTTYPLGGRVIKADTHRIYESAIAGNVGKDPATSADWIEVGATNRWAMFDQALGSATTAASPIAVTLDAGAANAVALLDVLGATVRVQAPGGYDQTTAVSEGAVTFLDLPGVSGQVTITVAGTGSVAVGTLLIGKLVALGITEAAPTAGIADYSRKETDDFGEVTVIERAWAKRMTASALIRTDAVDLVVGRVAAVRAQPSLWIGDVGLDALTAYGFFKDFSVELGEGVSKLSLTVEGLSKAAPLEPLPAGPPGADAKAVRLTIDKANFTYDGAGNLSPATQSVRVIATPQNAVGPISWRSVAYGATGVSLGTVQLRTTITGTTAATTETNVYVQSAALPAGTHRVLVEAQYEDYAYFDALSIGRQQDGAQGPQGPQGPQGSPGTPGADGQTLYTWIAYANDATGTSGFTNGAWTNQTYIGIANNKTTQTESTNPADYTWSLIRGDQGVPGTPGADGQTTYTWFAYANNATGTSGFTTGAWTNQTYLGLATNKTTPTESTNPADYTWSKIEGAQGPAGAGGLGAYLTNEAHTFPADSAGNVTSYAGNGGSMVVFSGTTNVTSSCTFALASASTGLSVTVQSYGSYTFQLDAATNSGTATIRGTYGAQIVEKILTVSKSKAGATGTAGANAKTLVVSSTTQTIAYDGTGAPSPASQTNTFTANRQNSTATVNWSVTDANGVARTPVTSFLSAATGLSVTMTEAQFASARNGTTGVRVTASMSDGGTIADSISVLHVQDGAEGPEGPQGPEGPVLVIKATRGVFTFVDGVLSPSPQAIEVAAFLDGVAASVQWAIKRPDGVNVRTATGTILSVTDTDLGAHAGLRVEATHAGGTPAPINIERHYGLSSGNQSSLNDLRASFTAANGAVLSAVADGFYSTTDKATVVAPRWAAIQAEYARMQAEAANRGAAVSSQKTAQTNAYNTLAAYIANVGNGTAFFNGKASTAPDLIGYLNAYADAAAHLQNAMNGAAATTATWPGVTGTNRPEDNATASDNLLMNTSFAVVNGAVPYWEIGPSTNTTRMTSTTLGEPAVFYRLIGNGYVAPRNGDGGTFLPLSAGVRRLNLSAILRRSSDASPWAYVLCYVYFYRNGTYIGVYQVNNLSAPTTLGPVSLWFEVPANATHYTLSFGGQTNSGYIDLAEPRVSATERAATVGGTIGTDLRLPDGTVAPQRRVDNNELRLNASQGQIYLHDSANANVDVVNLADAGIAPLAYKSAVDFASGEVTNKSAEFVAETVSRRWAGESGADVTVNSQIVIIAPDNITISCDANGVPASGQLPRLSSFPIVSKGGVSVRTASTTTYAATFSGCAGSINNTAGSADKGRVTITDATADSGWVNVIVTVDGKQMPAVRLYVYKDKAAAPTASPSTSGSGTGPSSNSDPVDGLSSTAAVRSGPFIVRAGSTGKVNLAASFDYHRSSSFAGSTWAYGKFQYRPVGGTLTDVSAYVQAASAAQTASSETQSGQTQPSIGDSMSYEQYPGHFSSSHSVTGLVAGNDYEFQFVAYTDGLVVTCLGSTSGTAS